MYTACSKISALIIVAVFMTTQLHGAAAIDPSDPRDPSGACVGELSEDRIASIVEDCKGDLRAILVSLLDTTSKPPEEGLRAILVSSLDAPEQYGDMQTETFKKALAGMSSEYKLLWGHYRYLPEYSFEFKKRNLFLMGMHYYRGVCEVPENKERAFQFFMHAAKLGDSKAQRHVGLMYHRGSGVSKDYSEAFNWYKRAAISDLPANSVVESMEKPNAQYAIGRSYYYGEEGLTRNLDKAFEWFKYAADKGHVEARYALAGIFIDTNRASESVPLLEAGEQQGHLGSKNSLGISYINGRGVLQDKDRGFSLCLEAANEGLANAQYSVGTFYEEGKVVKQDMGKAMEWYEKAANQGLFEAIEALKRLESLAVGGSASSAPAAPAAGASSHPV